MVSRSGGLDAASRFGMLSFSKSATTMSISIPGWVPVSWSPWHSRRSGTCYSFSEADTYASVTSTATGNWHCHVVVRGCLLSTYNRG